MCEGLDGFLFFLLCKCISFVFFSSLSVESDRIGRSDRRLGGSKQQHTPQHTNSAQLLYSNMIIWDGGRYIFPFTPNRFCSQNSLLFLFLFFPLFSLAFLLPLLHPIPSPSINPLIMSTDQDSSPPPSAQSGAPAAVSRSVDQGPIICPGHSRPVPDLSFTHDTPDGYFLVSACLDNKAMLRDGATGDWIGTFMGHKGAVWCARLNRPATQAATAAADFSAKIWDALTGAELHTLQHKHIVKSLAFSDDGSRLYTGGQEKKLRIFDLGRIDADPAILEDHKANITNVWTVKDENLIVTAGAEKDIRFWDRRTLSVGSRLATGGEVRYCQPTLDGSILSVSTTGKEVSFYHTHNMALIKTFNMPREVDCISYDPINQRFVTVR